MPEISSFPKNCGLSVFHSFGGDLTATTVPVPNKDVLTKWLDTNEEHQRKMLGMAAVVVSLNEPQMIAFGQVLKDRGYRFFDEPMFNARHGTRNYLGYKPLREEPKDIIPYDPEKPLNGQGYGNNSTANFGGKDGAFLYYE